MNVLAVIGIVFAVVLVAVLLGLVFVRPDYDRYPDGRWPRPR